MRCFSFSDRILVEGFLLLKRKDAAGKSASKRGCFLDGEENSLWMQFRPGDGCFVRRKEVSLHAEASSDMTEVGVCSRCSDRNDRASL